MADVDPDQEAARRRLRAGFVFIRALRILDHHDGQCTEEGEELPPADR